MTLCENPRWREADHLRKSSLAFYRNARLLRASLPLPWVASVLNVAEPSAVHAWDALAQPWCVAIMPRPADAAASLSCAADV